VSRRRRALVFLALALLAATAAAAIAEGYGSRLAHGYGPLRPVVVAGRWLAAGTPIDPTKAASALAVRRVPERFVPPGALRAPSEALGLQTAAPIPIGAYLIVAQLRPPRRRGLAGGSLGPGRGPVEIAVSGAEALLHAGAGEGGAAVDVVVTKEPRGAGGGRTYVAARSVPLLALRAGSDGTEPGGTAAATLALTRRQALRLIAAESFARRLTLIAAR
jgi:Flp pilus assembly protein CpaB